MGASAGLVNKLIQAANESGAIRAGPHSLLNLRQSIQGVPFALLKNGMADVLKADNLLASVRDVSKLVGGLQNLGSFQTIIQAVATGTATADQLVKALGAGQALGAALMQFGGGVDAVKTAAKPQQAPAGGQQEAGAAPGPAVG